MESDSRGAIGRIQRFGIIAASLVLTPVAFAPARLIAPQPQDCRDTIFVDCCDFLTQNLNCIIDPIIGGCVEWEPFCCDIPDYDSSPNTRKAAPNGTEYTASSYNMTHINASNCYYYRAYCDFGQNPVCQHEDDPRPMSCWDQTVIPHPTDC